MCVLDKGTQIEFGNNQLFFGNAHGVTIFIPDIHSVVRCVRYTEAVRISSRTAQGSGIQIRLRL